MADPRKLARQIALENDLDPDIFDKLIQQESGFNPRAVSPAGAQGLTQLMPATARGLGVRDPFDPEQNLRGGARFLKQMLDRYGGDYRLALAAYNAGPGAVDKYGDVPPFEETQTYIRVILGPSGAKVLAKPAEADVAKSAQDVLGELARKHGEPISILPRDPEVADPGDPTGPKIQNLSPTYRFLYRDGTYIDVKSVKAPNAPASSEEAERYEVVTIQEKGGDSGPDTPPIREIGGDLYERGVDGAWKKVISAPAKPKDTPDPLVREVDGSLYERGPDGEWHKAVAAAPTRRAPITIGRSVYREKPDGSLEKILEEPRDAPQRAERWPEEVARSRQQLAEGELDIEKKQRDLQGEAAVLLRNHISLIDSVEKMVADGQLKPEQAAEYISTSDKNYRAALRGSTLATEQERMRADRRAKNTLGSDIINQRLSSGANLAAQLSGQAMQSDVMMPVGKSSLGYSPSMLALEMTKELGGGPEVSEFAKRMLLEEDQPWL